MSGKLVVRVTNGTELADATVNVIRIDDNREVARGRTYTSANTNPNEYELAPGRYRVRVRGVRIEGDPEREFEILVTAGTVTEHSIDLGRR